MSRSALFFAQSILLVAAVIPLATAEGAWFYLLASVLAVTWGWRTLSRGRRPLLGPVTSRVFVVGAFSFLIAEYIWLVPIPVVVLSHFMTLVCISKFLQDRTLRDDAQLVVLLLLLLVVAAIVSGNLIFPLVLAVFLTVGLEMMVRFNLMLERARAERSQAEVLFQVSEPAGPANRRVAPIGPSLFIAAFGLLTGVAIFMFFPRVGAGMFGRVDNRGGGSAVTGLASTINFNTVGPVTESDRLIMSVHVDTIRDGKRSAATEPMYFRGKVFDYYARRALRGGAWEWQRLEQERTTRWSLEEGVHAEDASALLEGFEDAGVEPMLIQTYTLDPAVLNEGWLFTVYPAVAMGGVNTDELDSIIKYVANQNLRVHRAGRRPARYIIKSPVALGPSIISLLDAERLKLAVEPPKARPPLENLPLDAALRREIVEPLLARVGGSVDNAASRESFVKLVEQRLKTGYRYTLSPAPLQHGSEPIGEFLLRSREGYCQHFASAMAIVCQMAGVPARLVTGFRCDAPLGGVYSVRGRQSHAWVEVYIPGRDWVMFDPTPAAPDGHSTAGRWLNALRRYLDYFQYQWARLVLTYDSDVRRSLLKRFGDWLLRPARDEATLIGKLAAFAAELFTWRIEMSWRDRLLYWVVALLMVSLVILIGYVVAVLCWRLGGRFVGWLGTRWTGAHRAGDAGLYHRFRRRLMALGLRKRPEQTPAEFAAELAAQYPAMAPAPELISAYYEVIYGGRALSEERRSRFESFLDGLHHLDRSALT